MQRVGEDVIEQATQSLLTRRPAGDARFYRQGKPLNRSEVVDALRAEAVLAENKPLSATASVAALQEKRRQTRGFNELADMFERGDLSFQMPKEATGTMYEVLTRARPEDFIEWNTPIRQHSERVQSALEQVYDGVFGAGEFEFRRDINLPAGELLAELNRTADGNEIRQQLANLGVPGARFEGDNYVVYDDGLLDILRKYGFGAAAVGLGSAVAAPQRAEAADAPQSPEPRCAPGIRPCASACSTDSPVCSSEPE